MIKKEYWSILEARVFGGQHGDIEARGYIVSDGPEQIWLFWYDERVEEMQYNLLQQVEKEDDKYLSFFFDYDCLQVEVLPTPTNTYRKRA